MFNTLAKFAAAVKEAKRKQLKIREDKVRGKADSSRYQIRRRPSRCITHTSCRRASSPETENG